MDIPSTVIRVPAGTIVRLPYLPSLGGRSEVCGCCMRMPLAHDLLFRLMGVTDAKTAVIKSARLWGTHPECLAVATAQEYVEYLNKR